MGMSSRRSFRPTVEGFRLEERVALSATAAAVSATATVDPLNVPPSSIVSVSKVNSTLNQLHTAFQVFINRVERALTNASQNLSNGQNPDNLLAGLKSYEAIQAGNLQVQLQRVARTLPGGGQYLYSPPQGSLPAGTTYPDPASTDCGPDIRYFVPPALRLKTQVDTLVAFLNSATTLQQASSPDTIPTILMFYQNSRAATARYVHCANMQNVFTVPGLA
jgi:hypothetical protein